MTAPDTTTIRAQMEALTGFTAGPWYTHNQSGDWGLGGAHSIHVADANPYEWDQCITHVEYQTPYCLGEKPSVIDAARTAACNAALIAAAPDMHATILALCDEVERLRGLIENASQAASETQPSWEHRCYAITSALGLDFGEPTPDIPEQSGWYAHKMKQMEEDQFAKVAEISRLRAENERLRADRDQGAKDYCTLMDRRDALAVHVKKLELALRPFVEYVHDDFRRGKATYELVATDRAGGGLIGTPRRKFATMRNCWNGLSWDGCRWLGTPIASTEKRPFLSRLMRR